MSWGFYLGAAAILGSIFLNALLSRRYRRAQISSEAQGAMNNE